MSELGQGVVAASAGEAPRFRRVGSLAALSRDGNFSTIVEGHRIAVFRVGEQVVATQGFCPHAKGPLHEGDITDETLTCPWHGYTFNLVDGKCDDDPDLVLLRYEVRVDGDDILVRM